MEVKVGSKSIDTFRGFLEDHFGPFLTDWRFHAHLTIYRGIETTPEEMVRFKASYSTSMLSPINLETVTLRERKVPKGASKTPITCISLKEFIPMDPKEGQC